MDDRVGAGAAAPALKHDRVDVRRADFGGGDDVAQGAGRQVETEVAAELRRGGPPGPSAVAGHAEPDRFRCPAVHERGRANGCAARIERSFERIGERDEARILERAADQLHAGRHPGRGEPRGRADRRQPAVRRELARAAHRRRADERRVAPQRRVGDRVQPLLVQERLDRRPQRGLPFQRLGILRLIARAGLAAPTKGAVELLVVQAHRHDVAERRHRRAAQPGQIIRQVHGELMSDHARAGEQRVHLRDRHVDHLGPRLAHRVEGGANHLRDRSFRARIGQPRRQRADAGPLQRLRVERLAEAG